ncbi:TetR/AcrR family transcriptional regulator [Mycobacterium simiae]|uniref:TetR/AcrR family transcriptional regulator n=1 Tax=Mycobacterium simiae TaxID=1784 RepID=UPI0005CAA060|nr:TetR/AcrR family transcriptional regulator [Mycobacterium simiae]PLV46968.1 TetR family transcriptional regulator [Mycobacterium tuberculosis variant microti OV254]BBX43426.1 putative transcriptional regulator, TetR family protein [Mycobacterium simiae]
MATGDGLPRRRAPGASTERGRRTRAAIVEAAATIMYENGVAAASLDDVLAASGTGKSQLYHYFSSKSDLVAAVIDHQLERVLAAQPALAEVDSIAGIERWARAVLRVHRQPNGPFACPLGSIAAELKNDPAFRPALAAAFARWERPFADGLRTMQKRGELSRREKPDRLATTIVATLQGGMLLARISKDLAPLRDALNLAVDNIRQRLIDPAQPQS